MKKALAPDAAIAASAAEQHGVVTRRLADDVGMTRSEVDGRVQSGRWEHLSRGAYAVAGTPATWERSLAALHLATSGVVSHLAASKRRGFHWLPEGIVAEVTVDNVRSARSPLGVVHRSRDLHLAGVELIEGVPVTDAARTLLDIAPKVSWGRYRRILDDALDRHLVTLAELDACLTRHRRRGRPGVRRLAEALTERGDGLWVTESHFERRFLAFCDRYGIPRPDTQVKLTDRGRVFGRADCFYADERLIIELDGRKGHLQLVNREVDHERDQVAIGQGWRTMRVGWLQFKRRPETLAERILAALQAAGTVGPTPSTQR